MAGKRVAYSLLNQRAQGWPICYSLSNVLDLQDNRQNCTQSPGTGHVFFSSWQLRFGSTHQQLDSSTTTSSTLPLHNGVSRERATCRLHAPWDHSTSGLQPLLLPCTQQKVVFRQRMLPFLFPRLHYSSAAQPMEVEIPKQVLQAQTILQTANLIRLRESLDDEAQTHFHISFGRLLQLCEASGAAISVQEARDLAETLHKAGVVMLYQNIVYLRPAEVADIVLKALPATEQDTARKLQEIELELEVMSMKHREIDERAKRWPRRFLYAGCVVLLLQFVAFVRLTWWELSWDVMEPIAYMIQLFYALLGYAYFLAFKAGFDYPLFEQYWQRRFKEVHVKTHNFDVNRFNYLMRMRERYHNHLGAIKSE